MRGLFFLLDFSVLYVTLLVKGKPNMTTLSNQTQTFLPILPVLPVQGENSHHPIEIQGLTYTVEVIGKQLIDGVVSALTGDKDLKILWVEMPKVETVWHRPMSSDYSESAHPTISFAYHAYRKNVGVVSAKIILAQMSLGGGTSPSPDREMVTLAEETLKGLLGRNDSLALWWEKTVMSMPKSDGTTTEEIRTEVVINLVADVRKELTEDRMKNLAKGTEVKVVKGRKVPIGTVGTVIWMGSGKFGPRVGIKDAAGATYWMQRVNVEPTGTVDEALVIEEAKKRYVERYQVIFGTPRA